MNALKRVTRYMKGTRHFVNKRELDGDADKHVARRSASLLFQLKTVFDGDELWNG